jgi:hypothetical protein
MKLSDFISETLAEIRDGVRKASDKDTKFYIDNVESKGVQFDVAVTVRRTKGTKKRAGLALHVLEFGAAKKDAEEEMAVNRIQFNVSYGLTDEQIENLRKEKAI